jgi:N-acetylmuramoyl-L-alanine amidase
MNAWSLTEGPDARLRLDSVELDGIAYLSIPQFADRVGGRARTHLLKHKVELRAGTHTCVLTWRSPFLVLDDVAYRMPLASRLHHGALHVPAHAFLELVEPALFRTRGRVTLGEAGPDAPASGCTLLGLRVASEGRHTRLSLRTRGTLSPDSLITERNGAGRMSLHLRSVDVHPQVRLPSKGGHIREVDLVRRDPGVRVDIELDDRAVLRSLVPGEEGIVLSFEVPPQAEADLKLWSLDTIVIDPGHGGKDTGAVGPGRTAEKDVVLRVAKRLKPLLEKRLRVRTVLTREGDTFVPLHRRAQIARENGGKIFISLHCNASRKVKPRGAEVYFLSEAKTAEAADVARRENAVLELEQNGTSEGEGADELDGIRFGLLSTQFLIESQDLAALIRGEIAQTVKELDDRGVKQANFYVMRGTMGHMPSVLVEMGFISNPTEERRLRSTQLQKRLAEAIYRGLRAFKLSYEQQLSNK